MITGASEKRFDKLLNNFKIWVTPNEVKSARLVLWSIPGSRFVYRYQKCASGASMILWESIFVK